MELTDKERLRLAEYCEQRALSAAEIIKQLERSTVPVDVRAEMLRHERLGQLAFTYVANSLREAECFSVSKSQQGD